MRRVAYCVLLVACDVTVSDRQQAVVGGTLAEADEAVVAIVERPMCADELMIACSGTLIAPQIVLTAAHCVAVGPGVMREVHVGSRVGAGSLIAVTEAIRHPSYDDATNTFDLGLLRLAEPAQVSPVALPTAMLDATYVGANARVVGFGTEAAGAIADGQRRAGTMQISAVDAYTFAATPAPSNTCGGDSGGPVFVAVGAGEELLGVTVSGDPTCTVSAVNGRVDISIADFIQPYLDAPSPVAAAAPSGGGDDPCMGPPGMGDEGCVVGTGAGPLLALLVIGCRRRRSARRAPV